MWWALLTASALAQAEPAPEPAPEPPAEVAPAAGPAEPAPEPAPPPVEPPPDSALTIGLGGSRRLGDAGDIQPRNGFEVAMQVGRVYARPGGLELMVGGGFTYQRFRKTVPVTVIQGGSSFDVDRTFSFYEFQVHQLVFLPLGRGSLPGSLIFRPFIDVGAGLSMAYFNTREPDLAELRANRLVGSAAIGLDAVTTRQGARLGLSLGFLHTFSAPTLKVAGGREIEVFGDRAVLRVSFLQPF